MKNYAMLAAMLLACVAVPVFAGPISFPECPAVGADTTGCELLITVTGVSDNGVASTFSVTTSSPDLGPFNGSDDTLIGVLNDTSVDVHSIYFTVAPGSGSFDFNQTGACFGNGLVGLYSPGPTTTQCLNGQYWTTDAMDYASSGVTFLSFNLADAGIIVGEPSGMLAPGASTWFDLPGALTASDITMVTPEPSMFVPLLLALLSGLVLRRRSVIGLLRSID
jgi:hypothetical protein